MSAYKEKQMKRRLDALISKHNYDGYETYISKATAGEAKVPFFSISGSDFVEMFVGVYGGAMNFHNANFLTFHRIINFRQYNEINLERESI